MMKKINKKAQSLGGLYGGILVIASIGILLALVMYILSSIGGSMQVPNTAGAVVNETVAKPTTAGVILASNSLLDGSCGTITAIYNGTGGIAIGLGNITQTGCTVVNATATTTYAANWLISYPYTYTADTASSNATTTMVDSFVSFLPWLGIILLVMAAGVVLFFIIRSFGSRGSGV